MTGAGIPPPNAREFFSVSRGGWEFAADYVSVYYHWYTARRIEISPKRSEFDKNSKQNGGGR